jgi:hypothetical protein
VQREPHTAQDAEVIVEIAVNSRVNGAALTPDNENRSRPCSEGTWLRRNIQFSLGMATHVTLSLGVSGPL